MPITYHHDTLPSFVLKHGSESGWAKKSSGTKGTLAKATLWEGSNQGFPNNYDPTQLL